MLTLLCLLFKDIPRQLQNQVWISYDNMCNVVKMRAAQRSLPPSFGKFSDVWKKTNKMIDGLHISNHKDAFCKEQLGPDRFDIMYLDLKETRNSMTAERVFSWASRFKKIVSVMPKPRHLFYMHRMILRRNQYTSTCLKSKQPVLLPKIKSDHSL